MFFAAAVWIIVVFFWLFLGAVQFLFCAVVPAFRRYALSAALWWVVFGVCAMGLMVISGLATLSFMVAFRSHTQHLPAGLEWGYLIVGAIVAAGVATAAAWLHQAVVRRFTFALFRLYATVVVAGIGSVFGWCLSWWLMMNGVRPGWVLGILGMFALVIGFGLMAFRYARALRGEAPTEFAWVSREEFEGTAG